MEKRLLCGEEVSLLGFGAMRLPTQEDGTIDRVKAGRLVVGGMPGREGQRAVCSGYIGKSGLRYQSALCFAERRAEDDICRTVFCRMERKGL